MNKVDAVGRLFSAKAFSKERYKYQGHYADQSKWATKLTVGSEATSIRLFILVNESDHNLLK